MVPNKSPIRCKVNEIDSIDWRVYQTELNESGNSSKAADSGFKKKKIKWRKTRKIQISNMIIHFIKKKYSNG